MPEEVKKAYAARDEDDKYYILKKMADGMLAAEATERWTLEQVMVRAQQPAHRLALPRLICRCVSTAPAKDSDRTTSGTVAAADSYPRCLRETDGDW